MRYKKLFTHAEPRASTVSLLENLECDNIKEIIIINKNSFINMCAVFCYFKVCLFFHQIHTGLTAKSRIYIESAECQNNTAVFSA